VTGVGAALGKGAPVIVVGHVYTSEYEDRDGNRRSSLEMRATSVGPDVSRAIVRIEKPGYTGPSVGDAARAADAAMPAVGAADENSGVDGDTAPEGAVAEAAADHNALPLSA